MYNVKTSIEKDYNYIKYIKSHLQTTLHKAFEEEKDNMLRENAKKDESGQFVFENGNIVFNNILEVQSKLEDISNKHKDAVEDYGIRLNEYEKISQKTIDINIPKISLDDFPDQLADKIDLFIDLIDEPGE